MYMNQQKKMRVLRIYSKLFQQKKMRDLRIYSRLFPLHHHSGKLKMQKKFTGVFSFKNQIPATSSKIHTLIIVGK